MKRREFIGLVGGVAAWPLAARAQQARPVIGVLHSVSPATFAREVAAFSQGLKELGFEDGRNLTIEYRWAEGHFDRLPALAADLVARKVNVIAALGGNNSNLAAKAATDKIPIVFTSGDDPIKLGLVTSLSRPGGNITGVSLLVTELSAKIVGLLHQVVPTAKTVALLLNPDSREAARQRNDTLEAAKTLDLEVKVLHASSVAEVNDAFAELAASSAGALMVGGEPSVVTRIDRIIALAATHRIPTIYTRREWAVAGGLMSYGTNFTDAYRQAGAYVATILKGARPAELPVMQLAKFEFAVNLKTARALGLEFHPQLLATADEVIE